MAPLNTRTAAVVDPILSTHARGYRNAEFISHLVFPRVSIPNRSMRVIKFGKDGFRKVNTRRSPGATTKRVQFGYDSDPVSLAQDSLEGVVPVEHQQEAEKIPGIDLAVGAINTVLDIIDLGHEVEASTIARNAANYGANNKVALTGTARWTDPDSDPAGDVKEGREAIRRLIGRYPNTLTLGATVFNALSDHPKIMERFKYTSSDSLTADMLARYFNVERVIVGTAIWLPETAGENDPGLDVWGDDAILSFVPTAGTNYGVPSYGYTYDLMGYPQVEAPYFDRPSKSFIYPTTTERRVILTGADAGFLFQNAGQG